MKNVLYGVVATAILVCGADKPRVFVTESQPIQVAGDASAGDIKGSLVVAGGTTRENVQVMKTFLEECPTVVVTSNREKADFVIRLDHEGANPTTLFVRGNKVAVFNRDEDLIFSDATRLLSTAVKGACAAIMKSPMK